ncbi:MAG: GDSL-type esterase/lipase family protein [Anaerolineae bacterium]|jgi:lysophospholipase L1-like esterase
MERSRIDVYLFAGDSLTEGGYGESYVERAAKALYTGRHGLRGEVVNAGRRGDTATALLRRIDRSLRRHQPLWVILAIGSNDVWYPWLSSHSAGWWLWLQYRQLRRGQSPATDLDQFATTYRALIDRARQVRAKVLACTVSPLGERLSSPVNGRVARLNGVIKHVAADCQVPVADVWQAFVNELASLPSRSGYLSAEWLFAWSDRRRLQKAHPDEVAERRRLHLTFDGIHLNSRGADLWAETVVQALAQAQGTSGASLSNLARQWYLPCFEHGPLEVCCTSGWEVRARDLARLMGHAYRSLAVRTGAHPRLRLAVLNDVYWRQSACPRPYPKPTALWDGQSGSVFVPEAYEEAFLRDARVPEAVAAWSSWPEDLASLGEPAKATALADLLGIEELAHLFLCELQVAPADPDLNRLLTAYLAQVVLHALEDDGASMAAMWNAWGDALARAGDEEGRVRLQAKTLYEERGEDLIPLLTGRLAAIEKQVALSLRADTSPSSA